MRHGVVVSVLSLPYVVPLLLVATIRRWYVVLAVNPEMFALMLWYVFPVASTIFPYILE